MKKYSVFVLHSVVLGVDGQPVPFFDEKGNQIPLTVKEAFRRGLNTVFPNEVAGPTNPEGLPFDKKMERYKISEKIFGAETVAELSTEEQAELKKCVVKAFNQPEVVGFLNKIFEGESDHSNQNQ